MTSAQRLWWRQAASDFDVFELLLKVGARPCHLLHYLQMAAEKLSKAYLWRTGRPPPASHTGLRRFIKILLDRSADDRTIIAKAFGFDRATNLEGWAASVEGLAYELERMAPGLDQQHNSPNAEYPWPHHAPKHCPADYDFPLWRELEHSSRGRALIGGLRRAVRNFGDYG